MRSKKRENEGWMGRWRERGRGRKGKEWIERKEE